MSAPKFHVHNGTSFVKYQLETHVDNVVGLSSWLATFESTKLDKAGDTATGKIVFSNATTHGGTINLPRLGTANPANTVPGDFWYRSNNLYYNNEGTIRAVAHTGSWGAMSVAEGQTGTATSSRFMRADRLKSIIEHHARPADWVPSWSDISGTTPTWNQNTTGSAASLTTARTINGTSFNGTANITTANWGTARTLTIGSTGKSVNGSGNVAWSLAEIGAAAASHNHTIANVTGLQTALDAKADLVSGKVSLAQLPDTAKQQVYVVATYGNLPSSGLISGDKGYVTGTGDSYIWNGSSWLVLAKADWENVSIAWGNINDKPATATRWPTWSEVTGKPSTFPPSSHTHPWSQVISPPATATRWPTWSEVTGKPSTFPPSSHTHPISDVTDLQNTLNTKVNLTGNQTRSNGLLDLQDSGFANQLRISRTGAANYSVIQYFSNGSEVGKAGFTGAGNFILRHNDNSNDDWVIAGGSLTTGTVPWARLSNVPTTATRWPTWSEVTGKPSTFDPTSHSHGAITNTGTITADTAVASGHKIVTTDGSSVVRRSGISFGTSTTQYLRNNGTWATPTNTTYSEISTAEIDAGTASTLRTITGRRMAHAFSNVPVHNVRNERDGGSLKVWVGTEAQYDAIGSPSSSIIYIIEED